MPPAPGVAPRVGTEALGLFNQHWGPRAQLVQGWWDGDPAPALSPATGDALAPRADSHRRAGVRGSPIPQPPQVPPIFPSQNIMFLGDFNADCAYVQPSNWSAIRLRTSDIFKWLLPDGTDTTVGKSDCAYDR